MTNPRDPNGPADAPPEDGQLPAVNAPDTAPEHDAAGGQMSGVDLAGASVPMADDDLLAAVASSLSHDMLSSDALAGIDHALTQLTTSTDLFDVPPLDFDGGASS